MSELRQKRVLQATPPRKLGSRILLRWESALMLLLIGVFVLNMNLSPHFLNAQHLFTNVNTFLVNGLIALPMAFVLLQGDIDLSVGSIVVISATMLGIVFNATESMVLGIITALAVGALCGALNGLILTKFRELSAMIVTLGTMILFRGFAVRILGAQATGGMGDVPWFSTFFWGRIGPVPYFFIFFCILAVIFWFVMHKTSFGRKMFAIGANSTAAEYAGINVGRTRFTVFTLSGLMCGVSAIFFTSWMGSVRNNVGEGYELEAIAICVLGGMSTAGGKGTLPGVIIAVFIIGLLRFGFGLLNINPQTVRIIIGTLLITVVILQNLKRVFTRKTPA